MSGLDPADVFRQEARDLLDSLEGTLLDLGAAPDDRDLIDQAFRAMHTIKGSGAMFGFDDVAAFTHDFETAFDLVRKGEVAASQDLVTVALAARDHIRALIETPDRADASVGVAILADLQGLVCPAAAGADPVAPTPVEKTAPAGAGWHLQIGFRTDVLRNGTNPLALLDDLRELGPCTIRAVTTEVPDLAVLDPQDLLISWTVDLVSDCAREMVEDVFIFVQDEMRLVLKPLAVVPEAAATTQETPAGPAADPPLKMDAPPPAEHRIGERRDGTRRVDAAASQEHQIGDRRDVARRSDDKSTTSVRVQAERLDELMDRVGELVIAQARLSQLAHGRTDSAVAAVAEEIERLACGLRDITMGIRMVPIGSLFARFRRLIHDLSRDLGKPVDFVTVGEDTELDKTMIERLADPLVHLIRNAIDHGIETAERRGATTKAATGRIELRAEHVGAQVLITVRDDGGGLDAGRIRAKAEEQGLVPPGTVLSDAEIFQFLFHPGFSTAQTVSALSGRGVGMDVVKRTIEAMRGTIELSTVPGKGSTVSLRLPLTLAIIEGLLIRVGDARYVIPLSAIEECVELPAGHDAGVRGRSFLNIRGALVPFLRLRDMFDAAGAPDAYQKIIVTSVGDMRVGLLADAIIGSHQTVIKSLSKLHSDVTMFSGATILGDGSAALILDVAQLVALGQTKSDTETLRAA